VNLLNSFSNLFNKNRLCETSLRCGYSLCVDDENTARLDSTAALANPQYRLTPKLYAFEDWPHPANSCRTSQARGESADAIAAKHSTHARVRA
jgi:hypothetical protein